MAAPAAAAGSTSSVGENDRYDTQLSTVNSRAREKTIDEMVDELKKDILDEGEDQLDPYGGNSRFSSKKKNKPSSFLPSIGRSHSISLDDFNNRDWDLSSSHSQKGGEIEDKHQSG